MTEAGFDLDVAVLTKVMGQRIGAGGPNGHIFRVVAAEADEPAGGWRKREVALEVAGCCFSRDDAAAMRVVDEMVSRGWLVTAHLFSEQAKHAGQWGWSFWKPGGESTSGSANHPDRRVAICLAALAAVGAHTHGKEHNE